MSSSVVLDGIIASTASFVLALDDIVVTGLHVFSVITASIISYCSNNISIMVSIIAKGVRAVIVGVVVAVIVVVVVVVVLVVVAAILLTLIVSVMTEDVLR